ncbi:MAG: hypothetical protein ABI658_25505, partial [Acidimicrobiales bacterium]
MPDMTSMLRRNISLILCTLATLVASATPASAGAGNTSDQSAKPLTVAVIGDVPYGTAQEASFGELIAAINADPKVRIALHVGDIKNGSTTCTDERFTA